MLIADPGTEFYDDPTCLTAPTPTGTTADFADNVLQISAGTEARIVLLRITAFDGFVSVTRTISVNIVLTAATDDVFATWAGD